MMLSKLRLLSRALNSKKIKRKTKGQPWTFSLEDLKRKLLRADTALKAR